MRMQAESNVIEVKTGDEIKKPLKEQTLSDLLILHKESSAFESQD